MSIGTRRYAIYFQFTDREACLARCNDMFLDGEYSQTQISELTEEFVRAELRKFYARVFPQEVVDVMPQPARCIAVPYIGLPPGPELDVRQ